MKTFFFFVYQQFLVQLSFIFFVGEMYFHQVLTVPVADYSSVRHQVAERKSFDPTVGSALPDELLADPVLATLQSDLGSLFVRPYDKVKRSPQNDAFVTNSILMKITDNHRSARRMRLQRVHNIDSMDAFVNRRNVDNFNSLMWQNAHYDTVEV